MGMSASQARLLTLTSRQYDLQLKRQNIANSKMALTNQSDEAYSEYSRALNKQNLAFQGKPLSIGALQEAGYSVATLNGVKACPLNKVEAQEKLNIANAKVDAAKKVLSEDFNVSTNEENKITNCNLLSNSDELKKLMGKNTIGSNGTDEDTIDNMFNNVRNSDVSGKNPYWLHNQIFNTSGDDDTKTDNRSRTVDDILLCHSNSYNALIAKGNGSFQDILTIAVASMSDIINSACPNTVLTALGFPEDLASQAIGNAKNATIVSMLDQIGGGARKDLRNNEKEEFSAQINVGGNSYDVKYVDGNDADVSYDEDASYYAMSYAQSKMLSGLVVDDDNEDILTAPLTVVQWEHDSDAGGDGFAVGLNAFQFLNEFIRNLLEELTGNSAGSNDGALKPEYQYTIVDSSSQDEDLVPLLEAQRKLGLALKEQAEAKAQYEDASDDGAALYKTLSGSNGSQLLNDALQLGQLILMKDGVQVDPSTDTLFKSTGASDLELTKAKSKYDSDMRKIDNKEKELDRESEKIGTELSAIEKECESVKSVISKNIEVSFKMFS